MASEVAVKLAPSILSADFARLGEQVAEVTRAGADYIHVDVMDGRFVPNLTVGPVVVEALRRWTHLPLDVHLMIVEPERLLEEFIKAGASHIIVHVEATLHLHRLVQRVREAGLKVGVALNPSTPLSAVEEVLPSVDVVVVSTVNPGFAGQALIPEMLQKVRRLRDLLDERGYQAEIQVDGGINAETVPRAVQAGARILVAGSAIFNDREPVEVAVQRLRESLRAAGVEG